MRNLQIALALVTLITCAAYSDAQDGGQPNAGQTVLSPLAPGEADAIVPGKLVHKTIPKYPKEARKAKIEGEVVAQATIEPSGNVSSIAITAGDLKLAEEVVDAVKTWKFEPYSQDGKPVRVLQNIAFKFALDQKHAEMEPLPAPAVAKDGIRQGFPGGGVYRIGGAVSAPRMISSTAAQYSEKARRAKYQGVCILSLIVTPEGTPRDVRIVRSLGMGLDEKAIEAVSQWKFEPGMKDGKPVAVFVNVEVNFHLY